MGIFGNDNNENEIRKNSNTGFIKCGQFDVRTFYDDLDKYVDERYIEPLDEEALPEEAVYARCEAPRVTEPGSPLEGSEVCYELSDDEVIKPSKKINKKKSLFSGLNKASCEAAGDSAPMASAMCMGAAAPGMQKADRSLEDMMKNISQSWQEMLFRLIDEKGYTDTEVYKRAEIDRKLFSKIRSNTDYKPKKNTAIALALSLNLNLDETKDFLGRAGYALSPSSRADLIVQYFIEHDVYDIYTINLALFDHGEPTIGE